MYDNVDIEKGYVHRDTVEKYFKSIHIQLCEVIDKQVTTGRPANRQLHKILTELETIAPIV